MKTIAGRGQPVQALDDVSDKNASPGYHRTRQGRL